MQDVKQFVGPHTPKELVENWVMVRRRIPIVPVMHGCPTPAGKRRNRERTSTIFLTYFRPWTLVKEWATDHVPHVASVRGASGTSSTDTFTSWVQGKILTEEMRRVVTQFMSVTSVRPQDNGVQAANSGDDVSDAEIFVADEDLDDVLKTQKGGGGRRS